MQKDYNLIIFNSAGNDGAGLDTITTHFPREVCIAVGAVNLNNGKVTRASYSSTGEELDFSTFTCWYTGTSFASPWLAGMACMILQRYGDMSQQELYAYLKMISKDLGKSGVDNEYGWGIPILPDVSKKYITMITRDKVYHINGKKFEMDTKPVNKEGNVFVPLRVISEALNGQIDWKFNADKTINIIIIKGDTKIELNTASDIAFVNGKKSYLNFAPYIDENNRTLVPIRFLSESLNCIVDWVQRDSKVMILEKIVLELMSCLTQ